MKKRKVILGAAIAATVATSGMFGVQPVRAEVNTTISKAAEIIGVSDDKLIDAIKEAKIKLLEESIKNGSIDPVEGVKKIHEIEESGDFYVIPK